MSRSPAPVQRAGGWSAILAGIFSLAIGLVAGGLCVLGIVALLGDVGAGGGLDPVGVLVYAVLVLAALLLIGGAIPLFARKQAARGVLAAGLLVVLGLVGYAYFRWFVPAEAMAGLSVATPDRVVHWLAGIVGGFVLLTLVLVLLPATRRWCAEGRR